MNIEEFQSAFAALNHIAQQVDAIRRDAVPEIADGKVAELLESLDLERRVIRSMIGKSVGLPHCEHCWPNEILVPEFGGLLRCPGCGIVVNERLTREAVTVLRPYLWHEEANAEVPFAHSRQ